MFDVVDADAEDLARIGDRRQELDVSDGGKVAAVVLFYYAVAGLIAGIVLSVVFQAAHCVEEAEFPLPREDTGRIEHPWAIHQADTTVDFARRSRVVTWLVGVTGDRLASTYYVMAANVVVLLAALAIRNSDYTAAA